MGNSNSQIKLLEIFKSLAKKENGAYIAQDVDTILSHSFEEADVLSILTYTQIREMMEKIPDNIISLLDCIVTYINTSIEMETCKLLKLLYILTPFFPVFYENEEFRNKYLRGEDCLVVKSFRIAIKLIDIYELKEDANINNKSSQIHFVIVAITKFIFGLCSDMFYLNSIDYNDTTSYSSHILINELYSPSLFNYCLNSILAYKSTASTGFMSYFYNLKYVLFDNSNDYYLDNYLKLFGILVDFPGNNPYRELLSSLDDIKLKEIIETLSLILEQILTTEYSYIYIYSLKRYIKELFVVLFRLIDTNQNAMKYVLDNCVIILSSLLYIMYESMNYEDYFSLLQLCTFILLSITFQPMIRSLINHLYKGPMNSVFPSGMYIRDIIIYVIISIILKGNPNVSNLYKILLVVIKNIVPYTICLHSSVVQLFFKLFDTIFCPKYILSNNDNYEIVSHYITIINVILYYQYQGNSNFIYEIYCRKDKIHEISDIFLLDFPEFNNEEYPDITEDKFNILKSSINMTPINNTVAYIEPQINDIATQGGGRVDSQMIKDYIQGVALIGLFPPPDFSKHTYIHAPCTELFFTQMVYASLVLNKSSNPGVDPSKITLFKIKL